MHLRTRLLLYLAAPLILMAQGRQSPRVPRTVDEVARPGKRQHLPEEADTLRDGDRAGVLDPGGARQRFRERVSRARDLLPRDAVRGVSQQELRRVICETDPVKPSTRVTGPRPASRSTQRIPVYERQRELAGDLDWITLQIGRAHV